MDFKTVKFVLAEFRNKNFPNAGIPNHAHRVAPTVPAVEIADNGNAFGIRGPNGKLDTAKSLMTDDVRSEFFIQFVMGSVFDQVAIEIGQDGKEGVRVDDGILDAVIEGYVQPVKERLKFHVENGFKKSRIADFQKVENEFFGVVLRGFGF